MTKIKAIAFYLPQYHPIPENDQWWGKGFTEWTNVTKAKPNFEGHYQPHLPSDLGFYDLRLPEVRLQQAQLAKEYGIYGFCYHYYWFNGKRLLSRPLDEVFKSKQPNFPFCVCWANENWTRRWDGLENEILIAQNHSLEDDKSFIDSLIPLFIDDRYIKIDGKPLLIVYRISLLPNAVATAEVWRSECKKYGIEDIYLCAAQSFGITDPRPYGFDAAVEFPPHKASSREIRKNVSITNKNFDGRIYDYQQAAESLLDLPTPDYRLFKTVMPSWDNTPRRQNNPSIYLNSSPQYYKSWLLKTIKKTQNSYLDDEQIVFINAWNEWGEGCHLEPDMRYGHLFLEATREAIDESCYEYDLEFLPSNAQNISIDRHEKISPLVSICLPTFNGSEYILEALKCIESQTYKNLELIISDDGSTDNTIHLIKDFFLKNNAKNIIKIYLYQHKRYGLVENWNFCISMANGKYIKFLFQDDLMLNDAVEKMVNLAEHDPDIGLVFSSREVFIDQTVAADTSSRDLFEKVKITHKKWTRLKPIQSGQDLLSDPCMHNTFCENKIGEPSVTLIKKECFKKIGLFDSSLRHVVDIDMWYRIMSIYKIGFIDEPLSKFRIHSNQESFKNYNSGADNNDVYVFLKKVLSDDSYLFLSPCLKKSVQKQFDSHSPMLYLGFLKKLKRQIKKSPIFKYIKEINRMCLSFLA